MHSKLKILALLVLATFLLDVGKLGLTPTPVSAQNNGIGEISMPNVGLHKKYQDVNKGSIEFINNVLKFLTGIAAVWLLITIITAGIRIIQHARSPEDFATEMKRIMWASAGMILVALAYVLVTWILKSFFNDAAFIDNPVEYITKKSI